MKQQHDSRNAEDVALVARTASGDVDAIGALYEAYAARLCGVARRIIGAAHAEDVVHDVFVRLWERASVYDDSRGRVAPWLVCMTRNLAIDRLRRLRTRSRLERGAAPQACPPVSTPLAEPTLGRAILGVSAEQHLLLDLAFFQGLSYSEIAAAQGQPLGTIKSRVARALRSLRRALEAKAGSGESGTGSLRSAEILPGDDARAV
jgi:RNA polymerase sigma-70 factor, ECF subfamily